MTNAWILSTTQHVKGGQGTRYGECSDLIYYSGERARTRALILSTTQGKTLKGLGQPA